MAVMDDKIDEWISVGEASRLCLIDMARKCECKESAMHGFNTLLEAKLITEAEYVYYTSKFNVARCDE
jgi:hypothetical protein